MRRIKTLYNYLRDGINKGLSAGGVIIFLILIGLPAALPGRESLAPLAIPTFVLIVVAFSSVMVRRHWETMPLLRLILNGLALGVATAILFSLFMGLVNRWQANPDINAQDYFNEVTLETTARLSGVPKNELFANPALDRFTQDYPEGEVLRTNPMKLHLNNDRYHAIDLLGLKFGGIYGTALFLILAALVTVPVYRALLIIDWEAVGEWREAFRQKPTVTKWSHWSQLLLPMFLYFIVLASIPMNYNTSFWEGVLGKDKLVDMNDGKPYSDETVINEPLINVATLLNLGQRATQNFQLILSFATIIAFMVAMRGTRYHAYPIPYPIRILMFGGMILFILLMAIWRIQGNSVAFVHPTLKFLPGFVDGKLMLVQPSAETASLIFLYLVAGGLAIFAIWHSFDPYRFENTLIAVMGGGMMLSLPLFLDQYQTSVMGIVAINAMLGLGLNIVVGYAGLLDLGYVAFFAIGAYTYALVESNRRSLPIALANDLFFSILTALIIVPIIVFGASYLWQRSYAKSTETHQSVTRRMKPLWEDSPPFLVSVGLVIFAIVVALGTSYILKENGVFEATHRASPFIVGLIIAVFASASAGFMLGFPVLRLRSDYLAIVTLGFGEIISVAIQNPDLEKYTGGAFGADAIPKPLPSEGVGVAEANLVILYLAILGCTIIAFISMRLRNSRIGRSWTALRSDEDIAQAMGINLVNSKLLAFAIGASFAGAAGLLFASRQVNIRPDNFNLNVSINVLALVIIGGMGSIPGVIIGAIVLIGLPEVLRALSEYRILVFGALLVVMMLVRPQGLMPQPPTALEEKARQLRAKKGNPS